MKPFFLFVAVLFTLSLQAFATDYVFQETVGESREECEGLNSDRVDTIEALLGSGWNCIIAMHDVGGHTYPCVVADHASLPTKVYDFDPDKSSAPYYWQSSSTSHTWFDYSACYNN